MRTVLIFCRIIQAYIWRYYPDVQGNSTVLLEYAVRQLTFNCPGYIIPLCTLTYKYSILPQNVSTGILHLVNTCVQKKN
jgi:hypothetical protein